MKNKMMIIDKRKERIQKFDIARTFAILCVVLCHSTEIAYPDERLFPISDSSLLVKRLLFTIGRLGVPIFLFLTGALILKKQIEEDEDVIQFYKKNLLPLFLTTEIWIVLYNVFFAVMNQEFKLQNFFKEIIFLKQSAISSMWYMPMILGVYLALPFVAKIVKTFSVKIMKIPMIIVFVSSILLPSINALLYALRLKVSYSTILYFNFLGGAYGLYILLGYYISNGLLKKYSKISLTTIAIGTFWGTNMFLYMADQGQKYYNLWYDFVLLFICTICIFELFVRIKNKTNKSIFVEITKYISKISLGIFFLHEIFLKIFVKYTSQLELNDFFESLILFVLATICSVVVIKITSKIKIIKEKLYIIKEQ